MLRFGWASGWALCFAIAAGLTFGARAADDPAGKSANSYYHIPKGKLSGSYMEYSGELGEIDAPTKRDTKVSLNLRGPLAADLYKRLGPGTKVRECIPDNIIEWRRKGDLDCILDKETGLECIFGLDLKTGRSIIATEC